MSEKTENGAAATDEAPTGADALESTAADKPATLPEAHARIDDLRASATELEEEIAKIRDQFLRERAELENFKKRMTREKSEALRFATEPLIRELLPVIDNLERALNAAPPPEAGDANPLRDGVAMVAQQFDDILARFGVARVEAADQPFDPEHHEALAHVETTQKAPGVVLDEHLPGYRLHDRLLRPAQVTVAKAPHSQGN